MNLISHFVCAEPLNDPGRLGSVLPDLLRLLGRRPRPLNLVARWEKQGGIPAPVAELIEGVRFHHRVDSRFHSAPLFLETAQALRKGMAAASDRPGLKRFFAAHLLCEMYYDHLLIKRGPGLCDAFHGLLAREAGLAARFSAMEPTLDPEAVPGLFRRVLRERFVEDYRDYDGIFLRAGRILGRLGQRPLDEAETRAVALFFSGEAPRLAPALLQFIEAVQSWFGAQGPGLEPQGAQTPGAGRGFPGQRGVLAGDFG